LGSRRPSACGAGMKDDRTASCGPRIGAIAAPDAIAARKVLVRSPSSARARMLSGICGPSVLGRDRGNAAQSAVLAVRVRAGSVMKEGHEAYRWMDGSSHRIGHGHSERGAFFRSLVSRQLCRRPDAASGTVWIVPALRGHAPRRFNQRYQNGAALGCGRPENQTTASAACRPTAAQEPMRSARLDNQGASWPCRTRRR
jgi:hypothetical protein